MHVRDGEFALHATDLPNFLGYRHRTALDMGLRAGQTDGHQVRHNAHVDSLLERLADVDASLRLGDI